MSDAGLMAPLRWSRTAQGPDTVVLDAWCAAVGPAVVARPEPADGGLSPVLDSLVVVTWNVHVGGGDLVRLVADLREGSLTGGRPVRDFVLLLQEAHRSGPGVPEAAVRGSYPPRILERPPSGDRLDVVQAAERLGLYVVYAPSMRNGAGAAPAEDRGNAILATLPLGEPEAIELPYEAQRRVAVAATVSAVGGDGAPWSLRLVSAHLDNRSRLSRFLGTFGPGRARQARALSEAVSAPAAVIGADLNSWSAGFLEDAVPLLRANFPATPPTSAPTYRAAGMLPRKLDHLMARLPGGWRASVRTVDDPYGSDHRPLIGLLHRVRTELTVSSATDG